MVFRDAMLIVHIQIYIHLLRRKQIESVSANKCATIHRYTHTERYTDQHEYRNKCACWRCHTESSRRHHMVCVSVCPCVCDGFANIKKCMRCMANCSHPICWMFLNGILRLNDCSPNACVLCVCVLWRCVTWANCPIKPRAIMEITIMNLSSVWLSLLVFGWHFDNAL